jgi:hypothetical protein
VLLLQYKFIVDGQWRHDPNLTSMYDDQGNINNVMEVQVRYCTAQMQHNGCTHRSDVAGSSSALRSGVQAWCACESAKDWSMP